MTTNTDRFAILRTAKIKTRSELTRSLKHGFREQDTPNAAAELTPMNTHTGGSNTAEVLQDFDKRLETQSKIRKNAVLAVEYLVTASPEAINGKSRAEQDEYFKDALSWLEEKHGKENVIHAGVHRDEKSPHMYVFVVPIDDKGKLNCRHFLGGKKDVLSKMQDDFQEKVGQHHGLERGVKGSKAKHQSIQNWYKQVNSPVKKLEDIEIDLKPQKVGKKILGVSLSVETEEGVKQRVKSEFYSALERDVQAGKVVRSFASKNRQLTDTNKALSAKVEKIDQAKGGLTDQEVNQALTKARLEKEMMLAQEKAKEQLAKQQRREYFKKKNQSKDLGR